MDEYNKKMSEWQSKWEAKQNEVTHRGSRAVEGSGSVSSIAPAAGTYSGGGGRGTANWGRYRIGAKKYPTSEEVAAHRQRKAEMTGLNIA